MYLIMSNRKRSMPLAEVPWSTCGDPFPQLAEPRHGVTALRAAGRRPTTRLSQRLVSNGPADDPLLPQWVLTIRCRCAAADQCQASLKRSWATLMDWLDASKQRESVLLRGLDRVRVRPVARQALEREPSR